MKKKNAFVAISPDRLNSIYHQPFILKPNCLYMYICMIEIYMTGLFFGLRTLGTIVILYSFCFCITPVITMSESFAGSSIDQQCKSIDWFLCNLGTLIEVYSSCFIYVLFILFVHLFGLSYLCFCLLILLILLFVFVDIVVDYLFFNSFRYSCSGFS